MAKGGLIPGVEPVNLAPCFLRRPSAQIAARYRGQASCFLLCQTASGALLRFSVESLRFAGRTAQEVNTQNNDRPAVFADKDVERIATANFARGFDRGAVEPDMA